MRQVDGGQDLLDESMIDGYKIFLVDTYSSKLDEVASVGRKLNKNCCSNSTYSVSVRGRILVDYARFMIVPYKGSFSLPVGLHSDPIQDSNAGVSTLIQGRISVSVDTPNQFKNDPLVKPVACDAIADTVPGVRASMVIIRGIAIDRRRLQVSRRLSLRRLVASVTISYMILLPQEYVGTVFDQTTLAPDSLRANMNARLVEIGLSYKVFRVTVSEPNSTSIGDMDALVNIARMKAMSFGTLLLLSAPAAFNAYLS